METCNLLFAGILGTSNFIPSLLMYIVIAIIITFGIMEILGVCLGVCVGIFSSFFDEREIERFSRRIQKFGNWIKKLISKSPKWTKIARARKKVQKESEKREKTQQIKYRCLCETYVNNFWNDFQESPEETTLLLARLELALQNSGYLNWKKEFYDNVVKRAEVSIRPSKEQRQKNAHKTVSENLENIRINFNGLFVTPAQYRILSNNAHVQSLGLEDLKILCRMLAEKLPEFRDFLEGKIIQVPQKNTENNEAYQLFGLTFETLTEENLKSMYRRLVQLYHPDRNKNAYALEIFQKVQRYHEYLKTELRFKTT